MWNSRFEERSWLMATAESEPRKTNGLRHSFSGNHPAKLGLRRRELLQRIDAQGLARL